MHACAKGIAVLHEEATMHACATGIAGFHEKATTHASAKGLQSLMGNLAERQSFCSHVHVNTCCNGLAVL